MSGEGLLPVYRNGELVVVTPSAEVRAGDRVLLRSPQGEMQIAELLEKPGDRLRIKSLSREHLVRELPATQVQWHAVIARSGHGRHEHGSRRHKKLPTGATSSPQRF